MHSHAFPLSWSVYLSLGCFVFWLASWNDEKNKYRNNINMFHRDKNIKINLFV
jgi:hypothetical protein